MENTDWLAYKIQLRNRLRSFSLSILSLSEEVPSTVSGRIINNQLTKSGTSMYANYRAALRSRSKAEFFSKLSITVEEADETEMWLELLIASGIVESKKVNHIHSESIELRSEERRVGKECRYQWQRRQR